MSKPKGIKKMITIRAMTMEDYDKVYALWKTIQGFGIRSIDDSREGVERFLKRNPSTSIVAEEDGNIVGAILCGHDGRRGCLYHVCVEKNHRKHGIGKAMKAAMHFGAKSAGNSEMILIIMILYLMMRILRRLIADRRIDLWRLSKAV